MDQLTVTELGEGESPINTTKATQAGPPDTLAAFNQTTVDSLTDSCHRTSLQLGGARPCDGNSRTDSNKATHADSRSTIPTRPSNM